MGPEDVFAYAERLRAAGIEEVRFFLTAAPVGEGMVCHVEGVRLAPQAPHKPAEARKPMTEEELRGIERERKRARYKIELGYAPSDPQLDRLP